MAKIFHFEPARGFRKLSRLMQKVAIEDVPARPVIAPHTTVLPVLFAISFSHLLNDTIQALIPSLYPIL